MFRIAAVFAVAALLVAAPAAADETEQATFADTLVEVRGQLQDVRSRLAAEWEHARAVRAELEVLQESPAAASEGKAELAELRAELDDCRVRIESLRAARKGLAEERIALKSRVNDSPKVFAEAN